MFPGLDLHYTDPTNYVTNKEEKGPTRPTTVHHDMPFDSASKQPHWLGIYSMPPK